MTMMDAEKRASQSTREQAGEEFVSLLFADPDAIGASEEPEFFADLNLDQIVSAATSGRDEYELAGYYYVPLDDPDQVRFRQDVLDDLRSPSVRAAVTAFAEGMRVTRRYVRVAQKSRHGLSRQRWFLEATAVYRDAAQKLGPSLADARLRSAGLAALSRHLSALLGSSTFERFASASGALQEELGDLEYTITIKGAHVQVNAYDAQEELAPPVQETFARFAQGKPREYSWRFKDLSGLNHVEEQVLDRVARLFPEQFERLRRFCERYAEVFDERLMRFDREVQFFLGYLEFVEPLMARGLEFSRVELNDGAHVLGEDGFDLSLAAKFASEGRTPVANDFQLKDPERVLVVTGPNQGGKTTFARMIGQVYYLASLGLLVPARRAVLALPDRVFTHFEREESIETLRGKFEDELVRVHEILDQASPDSVIVMNESFNSTTLDDARIVGGAVLEQILDLGALAVYVTFVDELASISDATVSMVSQIVPDNPAERTFKVLRMRANGLAYAWAIAEKYGLTYDRLTETIPS